MILFWNIREVMYFFLTVSYPVAQDIALSQYWRS